MNIYNLINTSRVLGLLLMPFSFTMLPPILVAWIYHENTYNDFLVATIITFAIGFCLWIPFKRYRQELQIRETFLIVALMWIGLSLTGALPFAFSVNPHLSYSDSLFETISGLTTSGVTIIPSLESLPRSILYYRQQLQLIGGGGIILLGVAILPMLGIGGMQLFRAEIGGPFKENKLTPRIAQSAKALWLLYLGLTSTCALAYWTAGMSPFDAIGYSFSTISTGGFDMHDQALSFFNNIKIELICICFILIGAINFSLHFSFLQRRHISSYWRDPECKFFITFWLLVSVFVISIIFYNQGFQNASETFIDTLFQVTSFLTTTGFSSVDINQWPIFVGVLLGFLCLFGGCAGSTAGGLKMIRLLVLKKQGVREIQRLIHPNGHYVIKIGNNQLPSRGLEGILGLFCLFVATFILVFLSLLALGLEPIAAFSTTSASISNTGIGLHLITGELHNVSGPVKYIVSFAMLAGRLEFLTFLVLLMPEYWRY